MQQEESMSTSTLQLLPTTATEIAQLDPATLASIPGVAYDLKRLKVYSSCLRCRAKKVKCDRKEPCSRCVKHSVECSYRELASVQLDIRQFQRHLNNPKIRKDGAGIITSTATPIITLPSGDTAVLSPATTAAATLIAAAKAGAAASLAAGSGSGSNKKISAERKASKAASSSSSTPVSPTVAATPIHSHPGSPAASCGSSTDTESDTPMSNAASAKSIAMARAKVNKIIRRKPVVKPTVAPIERFETTQTQYRHPPNRQLVAHVIESDDDDDEEEVAEEDNDMDDDDEDEDEIERVVLRSNPGSGHTFSHVASAASHHADTNMSSETEDEDQPQNRRRRYNSDEDVPIWRAKAVGKHKQTVHEQDLAETFGLAAYLQAKESSLDSGVAGQTIDYDMELERALAQRLPTSFSRPDRSLSRARKYAQAGYNPSLPYARPSHCQLAGATASGANAPVAAACCCQIAAKQGQAPGTCFFSEKDARSFVREEDSSMSPPPAQVVGYEQGETGRIAYSPSYQPSYTPKSGAASTAAGAISPATAQKMEWSSSSSSNKSSMAPPPLVISSLKKYDASSASSTPISSPRIELPPIYLPKLPFHQTTPASSDLSAFQVGRHTSNGPNGNSTNGGNNSGRAPLEIACKFNEPNVDAWDMIEKPLSRTVPITTKRGRSVKMEMNWILS
ncbi:hypothetical protein EC991_008268 [Linnemannia zychae]|nr:hypothetical protein EC991_008268 [Linnemannia zychae]